MFPINFAAWTFGGIGSKVCVCGGGECVCVCVCVCVRERETDGVCLRARVCASERVCVIEYKYKGTNDSGDGGDGHTVSSRQLAELL